MSDQNEKKIEQPAAEPPAADTDKTAPADESELGVEDLDSVAGGVIEAESTNACANWKCP